MNLYKWQKLAERGTSGDMVHNILADWKRKQETRSAPDAALLAAAKQALVYLIDEAEWQPVKLCKTLRAAIAEAEARSKSE